MHLKRSSSNTSANSLAFRSSSSFFFLMARLSPFASYQESSSMKLRNFILLFSDRNSIAYRNKIAFMHTFQVKLAGILIQSNLEKLLLLRLNFVQQAMRFAPSFYGSSFANKEEPNILHISL